MGWTVLNNNYLPVCYPGVWWFVTRGSVPKNEVVLAMIIKLLIAILFASFSQLVSAGYIYEYTGNNFTEFQDAPEITGEYTSANSVTGYFTLTSPLAPNLGPTDLWILPTLTGLSFSDGRQTLGGSQVPISPYLFLSTDATGLPINWEFLISTASQIGIPGITEHSVITTTFNRSDSGEIVKCLIFEPGPTPGSQQCATSQQGYRAVDYGIVSDNPGSWTVRELDGQIPLPATPALFLIGCMAMLLFRSAFSSSPD